MGYKTWVRKQGRGAKSYRRCQNRSQWYCDGCQKYHVHTTAQFIDLEGRRFCLRTFSMEGKE